MILSRTMRTEDYDELQDEIQLIEQVRQKIGMWHPDQHPARMWEYALALKAFHTVYGYNNVGRLTADMGCGMGFMGPLLLWTGQFVDLYELSTVSAYMKEQMRLIPQRQTFSAGSYRFHCRGLGQLLPEDRDKDAVFCISVLEHIRDRDVAFADLLNCVAEGGLLFLTTDFAEDETDHYQHANVRAGKMFTAHTYRNFIKTAGMMGFKLVGGECDYSWSNKQRLVFDYGFASLALVREKVA